MFFTGPMDCGKSTLALQFDYTQSVAGRLGRLFTSQDRAGEATISSRLGLERPAVEVSPDFDFWLYLVAQLTAGERIDYLVCDETQFYLPQQIDQLARIVDELGVDVFAVGILTDFRTLLFPGSRRLVELADRIETLQVRSLCWCGKRATHNARTVGGPDGHRGCPGRGRGHRAGRRRRALPTSRRRRTRCSAVIITAAASPGPWPRRAGRIRCPSSERTMPCEQPAGVGRAPGRRAGRGGREPGDRAGRRPLDAERPTRSARVYEAGHLPGAVYVDLESELTTHGPVGGRHPLPDPDVFQRAMRRIGVSAATPVVVYDGATSLAASRLWWLLTDAGHPDVRVLDGGYAAWQAAGHARRDRTGTDPDRR